MPIDSASTSRYLQNTAAVLAAGQQLQDMLGEELETVDYAVTRLEDAAKDQETGATNYRAFMFSELDQTDETAKLERQRMSEDVFASVLVDIQVANVLLSAGEAVGEIVEKKDSQHLAEALNELKETTPLISRGLASPMVGGPSAGRFNFSGSETPPEVINSVDVESAIETFRKLSNEALDKLIDKTREVALAAFSGMKKLAPDKILEALNQFGGPVQRITDMIGRLLRQGLQKLQTAVDDLVKLVGNDAVTKIKDKIVELWNDKGGGLIDNLLSKLLGVQKTRDQVTTILALKGIDKDTADEGNNDISNLLTPFGNNVVMAKKTIEAIGFATGVLVFTPLAGDKIALFAASAYLVILTAVVVIAMDYADSGGILKRVRGVGDITNSLKPV